MTEPRDRSKRQPPPKPASKKREDALKSALRANLQRRKSQTRARQAEKPGETGDN